MTRQSRRSGSSSSSREDDLRLGDLLNEFQSLEEHEVKSFFSTFTNNQDIQGCLFRFLSRDKQPDSSDSQKHEIEMLRGLCTMLLTFYRNLVSIASKTSIMLASTANDLAKSRPVVLQYLPHLIAIHLSAIQSASEKKSLKFIEAFFLAIYNTEAIETQQTPQQQANSGVSVRVPGLSQSSIFHESSRLDAESIEKLNRSLGSAVTMLEPIFRQVKCVNASSRGPILQLLWRVFNRHLPDISKYGVDQVSFVTFQILNTASERRIFLSAPILMEMLHLSYFCIYNGFQVLGNQLLEQIDERASVNGWPSVLMVSSSIKRLSVTCGPSQSAIITSTPGQLAKHMITNASFRTKKISDDIPKVLTEEEGCDKAERMKAILEENINEDGMGDLTTPPSSGKSVAGTKSSNNNGEPGPKLHTSNKEKLMAKLPNLKVSISSKKDRAHAEAIDAALTPDAKDGKGKNDRNPLEKIGKAEKKKSGKLHVTATTLAPGSSANQSGGGSPSPTSLTSGVAFGSKSQNGDGLSVNSKTIDSIEQVEELIQMKKLPAETISIHSPESGTTLF